MTKMARFAATLLPVFIISNIASGQVNLSQGLVAYYPFNGNANDASGYGNNGNVQGATLTADRFNTANSAYYFDGVDDFIQVANSASLNQSQALTVTAFFYPERNGTQTIIGKINYTQPTGTQFQVAMDYSPYPGILYGVNPANNGCTGAGNNGAYVNTGGGNVALNQWYCMAAIFDNGVMRFYVNGTLIRTTNSGFSTLNACTNATMQIGSWWSGDPQRFKGKIDDIRIYNRPLNQQEVEALCPLQPSNAIAGFSAPDTVCVSNPVTITNTSQGASSYFWNFCVADLNQTPIGTNLGNVSGALSAPVFMDYAYTNGNYYGFTTNFGPGGLVRLDFGNSLLNTPTAVNLGDFGGIIPPANGAEGIQVIQNEGKWYVIMVGGNPNVPGGVSPRILKVELGTNIANPAPNATSWGNIGNMLQPIDLHLFKEGNNWYGFTVNSENNTITRFNFTNSFNNTPTGINLGNIGNLSYPTGIFTINDNGSYKVFITNGGDNTRTNSTPSSLTRLDFGNSLLNTPTGVNLGNPGNVLKHPRDLTIMRSCDQVVGFAVNGGLGANDIVKFDFNNNPSSTPVASSLGNLGNFDFPHSISKLFRVNEDIYGFVTNVANNTITRLRFPGCINASIPNSTAQNPPPVTYNTPGTYNINLTVDDGLPTQSAFCKQVVVLPAPVQSPTKYSTLCAGQALRIGTGTKNVTYLWNTGATTDSIDINNTGTYWVKVRSFGCTVTDTFKVDRKQVSDFGFKQDVCNPYTIQFTNAGTATTNPYWDLGDGTTITGNLTTNHVYTAFGDYTIKFSVQDGSCIDTATKVISLNVIKDDIIITPDTVICDGTTKQLRTKPALSFCWYPTTYLNNPNIPNPVTNTPHDITYYFNAETTGNNLITNGDFSAGNTGFTSHYNYAISNTTEGQYYVGVAPQAWNASLSPCTDHTAGNGNMMLINGSQVPDVNVWTQTITITPNTNYAFSTLIQALWNPNPAILQFSINGKDIGNLITASLPTCTWTQFYTTWNSGNSTTATIAIVNKNTQIPGNYFALDDISFAPVLIKRDSVVIKVDKPVVKTIGDTTVCKEKPVLLHTTGAATYTWSPSTGLSNPAIANPVASPAVSTSYIVTGTTLNGCIAKDTVTINTFPTPTITKTPDTLVCRNTSFPLFVAGGVSYAWSPADQLSYPNSNNPIATAGTAAITFKVEITDSYSCVNLDSIQVSVRPYPLFTANGNRAICEDKSLTLRAGGGDLYQWAPANLLDNPNSTTPVATPDTTTQFSVYILESTCNFDTTISMKVTVNPNPVLTVEKANDVNCNTPTAQLKATGALQYAWSPATGLNDPFKANPVAAIDTTTQYEVTGTNQYGCTSATFVKVNVSKDGIPRFIVPNAFSPNGDHNNDCFGIQRWGNAKVEEFAVYNRWGQLVFKTHNPAQCWDGTFNGKPQDTGGYIYVIKAKTLCGEVTRKGMVMLIR